MGSSSLHPVQEETRPRAVTQRRLIVNADDFGLSPSVNEAILRAHREGILTSASLMVNEPGFEEAVKIARQNPRLGVGLHLTFLFGHSVLSHEQIPGLTTPSGEFSQNPPASGFRFFFQRNLRSQLKAELVAQLEKFRNTGLPLDHVNGHLHMHLHPVILDLLCEQVEPFEIRRVRLTYDPLRLNLGLARGQLFYRLSHAVVFHWLSARARRRFAALEIRHTHRVFGLLQNARVDENYVLALLQQLPAGDSELYSHPSLDDFSHEFMAMVSPRVRSAVKDLGIELIRYQDL